MIKWSKARSVAPKPIKKESLSALFFYGAVGGIRTLVPLITATRFPIVLVMTTSIPLHIERSKRKAYYNKKEEEVKHKNEKRGSKPLFSLHAAEEILQSGIHRI